MITASAATGNKQASEGVSDMSTSKPEPCCPKCGSENIDGQVDYFDIEWNWCYDCNWTAAAGLFNMIDRRKPVQNTPATGRDESESAG